VRKQNSQKQICRNKRKSESTSKVHCEQTKFTDRTTAGTLKKKNQSFASLIHRGWNYVRLMSQEYLYFLSLGEDDVLI
jgi:hypothetical protein